MNSGLDILIFVEDPGAANFAIPLIVELKREKLKVLVLVDGIARDLLKRHSIKTENIDTLLPINQIMNEQQPKLLVIGTSENPDTYGLKLIQEARKCGIPSVGVIDARMNAEYRFRGWSEDSLMYAPDYLLVPDEWTKNEFYKIGYPKENISVSGHPHYDHVLEMTGVFQKKGQARLRKQVFPKAGNEQKIIIFISEGSQRTLPENSNQRYSDEYNFTGRGRSIGRTEIIIEEFLEAAKLIKPKPYLVLRLHPKDLPTDFSSYLEDFDYYSQNEPALEVVYASDLVVGMTSMLLCEAALMGKICLSIIPRHVEKTWLPSVYNISIPIIEKREEIISVLAISLKQKPTLGGKKCTVSGASKTIIRKIKRIIANTMINSQK